VTKQVKTFVRRWKARQVFPQKRRQVFVERLLPKKKTIILISHHRSLPMKRPVKHFENNGPLKKAGDEIRTRDSLLGRQAPPETPIASSKTALQADRTLVNQLCAWVT
jgi:hypothetical protein